MPSLNSFVQRLARDERPEESSRKRVPSAVRVHDALARERLHGELLRAVRIISRNEDRGFRALGEDDHTRAGGIRLGRKGEGLGDGFEIGLVRQTDGTGPCLGFGFVADDDVAVRDDLLELCTEELGDEGRRDVKREDLGECDWCVFQ